MAIRELLYTRGGPLDIPNMEQIDGQKNHLNANEDHLLMLIRCLARECTLLRNEIEIVRSTANQAANAVSCLQNGMLGD